MFGQHPILGFRCVEPLYNDGVMSRGSLTIRVVLSLCLVLNGLGNAGVVHARHVLAAERAQTATFPAAADAPGTEVASTGIPCHGADAGHEGERPRAFGESAATEPSETPHGCCGLAGCGGSCLQHPTGAITSCTSALVLARSAEAAPPRGLHASAELPHLTRPPIP
jgi:hypothetical protein